MNDYEFHNPNDVILFTLSTILDHLEKKDQLFAAQCIWWWASIIYFTDILIYHRHYKIFPSDYLKNCSLSPLLETDTEKHFEQDIPKLDLPGAIIGEKGHPILQRKSTNHQATTCPALGST